MPRGERPDDGAREERAGATAREGPRAPGCGEPALVRTLGHGTLAAGAFARLALGAGMAVVVDVRRYPGSRRHPHFGRSMAEWLAAAGLAYHWLPALGGRRRPSTASPNTGLRNEQFRGYADHMASHGFAAGVAELLDLADRSPPGAVAVMCAEAVPWRCHRSLLADHLSIVQGVAVEHLFHDGRLARHIPNPAARPTLTGQLVYSAT